MKGFNYAIESAGMVKVGYSKAPEWALSLLERNCPTPCHIISTWPRDSSASEIKTKFRHLRQSNGWYKLAPDLSAFLKNLNLS